MSSNVVTPRGIGFLWNEGSGEGGAGLFVVSTCFFDDSVAVGKDAHFDKGCRTHVFESGCPANAIPLFVGEDGWSYGETLILIVNRIDRVADAVFHHEAAEYFLLAGANGTFGAPAVNGVFGDHEYVGKFPSRDALCFHPIFQRFRRDSKIHISSKSWHFPICKSSFNASKNDNILVLLTISSRWEKNGVYVIYTSL